MPIRQPDDYTPAEHAEWENQKFKEGDPVIVVDGPFKELEGKIGEVDEERGKVKVLVPMFGRETPVELDFLQVKRI